MQPTNKYYSLADSIYLFAHAREEELPNNEMELAQFLARPVDPKFKEDYFHRLRNLALWQLRDPLREALREGISNACDAEKRAGREDQLVEATLDGHTFTLNDQGTGVGYKGIPLLFVDGKTSNPEAIFSVKKGLADVAGRFGQGFKSLFYYLLYPWKEPSHATVIKTDDGCLEISIPLIKDGLVYRVIFHKKPGQPVEISSPILDPLFAGKRKMVFWTRQGDESFQLRFKELKGELCWRLKPKLRATVGTTLTIESPLIEKHAQEIISGLSDQFAYLHPTPVLLNKRLINDYVGMTRYNFPECVVFVSDERCSEGGRLIIAEKGRQVVTLIQEKGPLVPKTLVLSFAALPLSHERSTLNWGSDQVKLAFLTLLRGFIEYPKWELSQKMEILNGATIALRQQYTGLGKQVFMLIAQILLSKSVSSAIVPDSPEIRSMGIPNAFYIHPDYMKIPLLEQLFCTTLRPIENPIKPIGYYGAADKGWLFIDAKTQAKDTPERSFYHTHLARAWLTNFRQGLGNVGPAIHFPEIQWPPTPPPALTSQPAQENFFTAENYTEETNPTFIEQHLRQFAINWDHQGRYLNLFKIIASIATKSSFLYLCDFLFLRRRAIVQQLIDHELDTLEVWTNFALKNCAFCPIHSMGKKVLTSSDHKRNALLASSTFDKLVALPTKTMRTCFTLFLVSIHRYENTLPLETFENLFLTIFSGTDGCDPNFAHYYFRAKHEALVRVAPDILKAFLLRLSLPQQEKALSLFHPLNIDPNHYLDWTDQELSEFIEDACIPNVTNTGFIPRCTPDGNFTTQQIQQLHLLYQTIPTCYRELRRCLLPYIFFDVGKLNAYHFQISLRSFNWNELICLLGDLVTTAKDEKAINLAIPLFQNTLIKAIEFIEIFLFLGTNQLVQISKSFAPLKNPEEQKKLLADLDSTGKTALARIQHQWSAYMDAYTSLFSLYKPVYNISPFSKIEQRLVWLQVLTSMEKLHLISDGIRPWIYAFFFSGAKPQAASTNFSLPPITEAKGKLAEDPFVLDYFGSIETARQNIQSARLQNSAPYFYINELLKNGMEAHATEIIIETHFSQDGEFHIRFSDNGSGMDKPELETLRTPGKTTKKRTALGANYGQGVYSVFDPEKKHSSMTVITRTQSNPIGHLHHFTLTPEEIFLQMQAFPKQMPGSTFIISKKIQNPILELLIFESTLVEATRYIQGVKIFYNGRVIQGASHNPARVLSSSFKDNQGQPQEVLGEIVRGEGTFFADGKKMGDVPVEYMQMIPRPISDLLKQKGLGVSLFFQRAGDQPMGRSQLVADPQALAAVQGLVLRLSFLAILQEWKDSQLLEALSKDLWDLRKLLVYPLTLQAEALLYYYTDPKNNSLQACVGIKSEQLEFDTLLKTAETYLRENPVQEPQLQIQDELIGQLKGQWDHIEIDRITAENVRTALLHAPLPGISLSFQDLRRKVIEAVYSARLIVNGEYSPQPTETIQEVFDKLAYELPTELGPLLNTFKLHLQKALTSCQIQKTTQETTPCAPCPQLEQFLIRMAKQVFNKDITVVPYTAADNRIAYVTPPLNTIWINLSAKVLPFHNLVNDFKVLPRQEWQKRHIPTIVSWIETLAHEITHLQDGVSCLNNTHDPAFGHRVAANLEPFFQKEGPILAIQILEDLLSS